MEMPLERIRIQRMQEVKVELRETGHELGSSSILTVSSTDSRSIFTSSSNSLVPYVSRRRSSGH